MIEEDLQEKEKSPLRLLREQAGLTRPQVKQHIGVSERMQADWESGKSMPTVENVAALANLYQVSVTSPTSTEYSMMWASCSPMKGMQNFLHGTVIHSSYYRKIPVTAFYTGENVQPQFLQVNRGIYITIDH